MKVTINKHGILKVQAENPLESYALDKWAGDHFTNDLDSYKDIEINVGFMEQTIKDVPIKNELMEELLNNRGLN